MLRQQFRETTDRLIFSIESVCDNLVSLEWDQTKPIPSHPDLNHEKLNLNLKTAISSPNFQGSRRRVSVFEASTQNEHQISSEILESQPQTPVFDDASPERPCNIIIESSFLNS